MMRFHWQRYPFLRLLIPLSVGIVCGDAHASPLSYEGCLAAALFLFLLLLTSLRPRFSRLFTPTLYLLLFGIGYTLSVRQRQQVLFDFAPEACLYQARLQEAPEAKAHSFLCPVAVTGRLQGDSLLRYTDEPRFLLYLPPTTEAAALRRGDMLWIHARLEAPRNNGNPDEFDYARHLRRKGIAGTAYVPEGQWQTAGHSAGNTLTQRAADYRMRIIELYRRLGFQGDELAVLSALTVGYKEELSDELTETYSVSGASHVLALSGLHIGLLYGMLYLLFAAVWQRKAGLKAPLLAVIVTVLWGFALLTGLSSSVVRSVTMFTLLALSQLRPGERIGINTLAATAFLMLLVRPMWLFDVGFQLSFSAVAAILLIQPRLQRLWKPKWKATAWAWGLITVSLAAQAGVAPLVMHYFARFSTHFLLTNLLVIPLVTLILYAAVVMLLLTPLPAVQYLFAPVVKALIHGQNQLLQGIEALPYASIDHIWLDGTETVLIYLSALLLFYAFTKPKAALWTTALCCCLLTAVYHSVGHAVELPPQSICFYNQRGCPAVHCLNGNGTSWLVCTDTLADTSRLRRSLTPHWNRLQIEEPQEIRSETHMSDISYREQLLTFGGRRICLLTDRRWRERQSTEPLVIDYLYVCRGYKGTLQELQGVFRVKEVIIDASLSAFYRQRIEQECEQQGIPCRSLSEKGAVRVLL